MKSPIALFAALCLAPALALAQPATEGRLKKIQDSKSITVAYRPDAIPFSFEGPDKKPLGYTVDLCRSVVAVMERQLGAPLEVKWMPVTAQTRFNAVASGHADMECGASTVTLGRMKEVDFSSLVFLDGAGVLVRRTTPGFSLASLADQKIGVMPGTTSERALGEALRGLAMKATVVSVPDREQGLAQLEGGAIDAFVSDRLLLLGMVSQSKDPKALALLADPISYEPYAIVLPRGDWALRQAVNAALAQVYRTKALEEIYMRYFSGLGQPGPLLDMVYGLGRLPE
ncbi:amino acid ABC transporter substrate-binding protein [Ramlibacter sp. XY19]|uniref:amino acid ABC transporter substrate-binding protein n=1 Tax=Ramlibacter paludis TaxID=2908000 RepID=UPI0023D97FC2|nr:amino acid ABC transporter substrate-binding protein [Ramlibacter paludis]MCG2593851.1 amino acid ABC transporter substrate-binding protein [Ramlibacter paludis]